MITSGLCAIKDNNLLMQADSVAAKFFDLVRPTLYTLRTENKPPYDVFGEVVPGPIHGNTGGCEQVVLYLEAI